MFDDSRGTEVNFSHLPQIEVKGFTNKWRHPNIHETFQSQSEVQTAPEACLLCAHRIGSKAAFMNTCCRNTWTGCFIRRVGWWGAGEGQCEDFARFVLSARGMGGAIEYIHNWGWGGGRQLGWWDRHACSIFRGFSWDTVPYCCHRLQDQMKLADRTRYGQQSCKFLKKCHVHLKLGTGGTRRGTASYYSNVSLRHN